MADNIQLTKDQLNTLKACVAELDEARQELFAIQQVKRARQQLVKVQQEIGLDSSKNYNITEGGLATEIVEQEVKNESSQSN